MTERSYLTDDADICRSPSGPMEMRLFRGENGDWYLSILPRDEKFTRHCVRITTSGNRCPDMPQAVYALFQAMGGRHG